MNSQRWKSYLMLTVLFCGAASVGWIVKRSIPSDPVIHADPLQKNTSTDPPAPNLDSDDLNFRVWLADALTTDDVGSVQMIARSLEDVADCKIHEAVFSRWFRLNPETAWEFAFGHSEEIQLIALDQWARIDPAAARSAVDSPDEAQFKALIRGAAESDIGMAFKMLGEAVDAGVRIEAGAVSELGLNRVRMSAFAYKDPQAAIGWAEHFASGTIYGAILHGWIQLDSNAAHQWLEKREDSTAIIQELANCMDWDANLYSPQIMDFYLDMMPAGNDKFEDANEVLKTLSYADPRRAVTEAERILKDPAMLSEAIAGIVGVIAEDDPVMAWEILDGLGSHSSSIRRVDIPRAEIGGGIADSHAAFPFSYHSSLTSMRHLDSLAKVKSRLLAELIMVDKEQAHRLMEKISPGDLLETTEDVFERWAYHDPEDASRWFALKLGGQGDPELVQYLIDGLELDTEELRNLALGLPKGIVRTAVETKLASDLAAHNPLLALEFAHEQSVGQEAVAAIYEKWADKDAKHALESLSASVQAPAVAWKAVVAEGVKQCPQETMLAVHALSNGSARDAAVTSLVAHVVKGDDPLSAAAWAVSIGEDTQRRKAMELLVDRATMDLRLAADEKMTSTLRGHILNSATIPGDEKKHWLEKIEPLSAAP